MPAATPTPSTSETAATAAPQQQRDRVLDWLEELGRVTASASTLTPAARTALLAVLQSIEQEDGPLPASAQTAQAVLLTTRQPRETPPRAPAPTATTTAALTRLPLRSPAHPAQTAAA